MLDPSSFPTLFDLSLWWTLLRDTSQVVADVGLLALAALTGWWYGGLSSGADAACNTHTNDKES